MRRHSTLSTTLLPLLLYFLSSLVIAVPPIPQHLDLASSSPQSLNLTPQNLTVSPSTPTCFPPGPITRIHIHRPSCLELLLQLLARPQATLPFAWDPHEMELPARFALPGCAISVRAVGARAVEGAGAIAGDRETGVVERDVSGKDGVGGKVDTPEESDVFSVVAVARAAAVVVQQCVRPKDVSWGGTMGVGVRGVFRVVISEA
ncbi:MAG: hypothetical protein Q9197_006930 [Variospora fuerteventurae]